VGGYIFFGGGATVPLPPLSFFAFLDVGLEEGEYEQNFAPVPALCAIIMVHKSMSSSYRTVGALMLLELV